MALALCSILCRVSSVENHCWSCQGCISHLNCELKTRVRLLHCSRTSQTPLECHRQLVEEPKTMTTKTRSKTKTAEGIEHHQVKWLCTSVVARCRARNCWSSNSRPRTRITVTSACPWRPTAAVRRCLCRAPTRNSSSTASSTRTRAS